MQLLYILNNEVVYESAYIEQLEYDYIVYITNAGSYRYVNNIIESFDLSIVGREYQYTVSEQDRVLYFDTKRKNCEFAKNISIQEISDILESDKTQQEKDDYIAWCNNTILNMEEQYKVYNDLYNLYK